MTETLRDILTPSCPLGTADHLILDWVHDGTLFRVKEVLGYYLDVQASPLFSFRLVTTPVENEAVWQRGWCYLGKDRYAWTAVLLAAAMWDGSDDTEPLGWNKNLQTREWREPGVSQTWQTARSVPSFADRMRDGAGPGASPR